MRGRLGASLRLEDNELVVVAGRWSDLVLPARRIQAIAFGTPGQPGSRAPVTFWRGDFLSEGFSHIVALRVAPCPEARAPRVTIIAEDGIAAAREAVLVLQAWAARNSLVLADQ